MQGPIDEGLRDTITHRCGAEGFCDSYLGVRVHLEGTRAIARLGGCSGMGPGIGQGPPQEWCGALEAIGAGCDVSLSSWSWSTIWAWPLRAGDRDRAVGCPMDPPVPQELLQEVGTELGMAGSRATTESWKHLYGDMTQKGLQVGAQNNPSQDKTALNPIFMLW